MAIYSNCKNSDWKTEEDEPHSQDTGESEVYIICPLTAGTSASTKYTGSMTELYLYFEMIEVTG